MHLEILKFTYQQQIVPKQGLHDQIIIGRSFTKNNALVTAGREALYLYTYNDGTTYDPFDNLQVKPGWISKQLYNFGKSWGLNDAQNRLEIVGGSSAYSSWAIGDNDNNLYLAVNQHAKDGTKRKRDIVTFDYNDKRAGIEYEW